jgi:pyridoxamine 5'-phosphate oxidase
MEHGRIDYTGEGLSEETVAATPWQQAARWVADAQARQAEKGDAPEPLSLSVATADAAGRPNVRVVLMRFFDEQGPGFVTNLHSIKGAELTANPAIAAALTWPAMFRAIRFRGTAELVGAAEVEEYWSSRPRDSRISAWASQQSQPVTGGRAALEAAFAAATERFAGAGEDIPVPEFWGGYRILCDEVEFWGGRSNRLHDRLVFTRVGPGTLDDPAAWELSRRQP